MSDTDPLAAFLEARLAEDEAVARTATSGLSGRWRIDWDGNIQAMENPGGGAAYIACGAYGMGMDHDHAPHIARFDPSRVLREVAAKRAILERYLFLKRWQAPGNPDPGDYEDWVLRPLATAWLDHPDYSERWKP